MQKFLPQRVTWETVHQTLTKGEQTMKTAMNNLIPAIVMIAFLVLFAWGGA
jgi:hypothetical protein